MPAEDQMDMLKGMLAEERKEGKSSPKKKKKAKGAPGGYTKYDLEPEVTEQTKANAEKLASNARMLEKRLKQPAFKEACFRKGIEPERLRAKHKSEFRNMDMSREEVDLRYNTFQSQRVHLIGVALTEEAAAAVITKKRSDAMMHREEMLAAKLDARLAREKRNIAEQAEKRKKYETALSEENARLVQQRMESLKHAEQFEKRQKQIQEMKQRTKFDLHAKARMREDRFKRAQSKRQAAEEKWKDMQEKRMKHREERTTTYIKAQREAVNKAAAKAEQTRLAKKSNAQEVEDKKRAEIEERMAIKQEHIRKLKEERDAKRHTTKIQRGLQYELRMDKASRMRKAIAYQKVLKAQERAEEQARNERLAEIDSAIVRQRKSLQRAEKIRQDKWKAETNVERSITPGPGAYALPSTINPSGGTWGRTLYKSEFDEIQRQAAKTPGPGHYGMMPSTLNPTGGCIATRVKTELDHMLRTASQTPGPGAYKASEVHLTGQSFSKYDTPGLIETAVRYNKGVPGPGQYKTTNIPKVKDSLKLQKSTRNIITVALMLKKLGKGAQNRLKAKAAAAAAKRPSTMG